MPCTDLHLGSLRRGDFGIINLDLSRRHLVQTLRDDSDGLAHLLHPTQVPAWTGQAGRARREGGRLPSATRKAPQVPLLRPSAASLLGSATRQSPRLLILARGPSPEPLGFPQTRRTALPSLSSLSRILGHRTGVIRNPNTKVWQGSCSVSEQEQNVKLSGVSGTRHGQAHQSPQLQNAALTGSSSDTGQGRGK